MCQVEQCKKHTRELKEKDVELAMEADLLTDKELTMLDLKDGQSRIKEKKKEKALSQNLPSNSVTKT